MQAGNQGATDDDAIGEFRHLSRRFAVADAETDADGDVSLVF